MITPESVSKFSQVGRYQELRTSKPFNEVKKEVGRMVKMALDDMKITPEERQKLGERIQDYIYGKL